MTKLKRDVRVSISSVICTFVCITYFRRCIQLLCVGHILYVFVNVYASDSVEKPSWEICRLRRWSRLWQLCIPFPWTMQKLLALPIHQAYFEVDYCVLYLYNRSLRSNLNSKGLNEKLASLSCLPVLCDWFRELWLAKLSLLWLVKVFFFRANYWSKNRFII